VTGDPGAGGLILVATPIGNLGDLSPRAATTLAAADVVACEDTRRTGRLLQHAGVDGARLLRVDAHTEDRVAARIVTHLDEGRTVAMVTDAGTPGISDPGERLVRRVLDAGHRVSVIPGPTAPVAALVASGLATNRWCMEGFLPRKGSDRVARLAELGVEERTIVLLESPRRLAATLGDLAGALGGDRSVAVARELTKLHEETWRGTLAGAVDHYVEAPKGEVVIVVAGAPPADEPDDQRVLAVVTEARSGGASTRDAADEAVRRLGVSRRRAYRLALGD
tara:strand:+ start:167 stop:1006 length:840 start_codon:yes stop_codon:yes gene_type:complete